MKNIIFFIRCNLSFMYKLVTLCSIKYFRREWVLSRVACLGNDVLKELEIKIPVINIQKGRSDIFTDWSSNRPTPKVSCIQKFMARKDIIPLLFQQKLANRIFELNKPEFVILDSYSELTDQKFMHTLEQWSFYANYGDVNFNHPKIWSQFDCVGLMPKELIEDSYSRLFTKIRENFGCIPIIFIHYPKNLENRAKFIDRADSISASILKLKERFEPFYNIHVDENIVEHHQCDDFPYHYNKKTYNNIILQILKLDFFDKYLKK